MPIDFNHNQMFNPNFKQNIVQQQKVNYKVQEPDVFVKNFKIDTFVQNYDGISISKKDFGTIEKTGEKAFLYTITNKNGASVDLSTYGATITAIKVPDKDGNIVDVTQGYNSVTPYEKSPIGHAGGTIGPYANKIANGTFVLNEQTYKLECNKDNGKSHSHGGTQGFDTKNWKAKKLKDGVEFSQTFKDMENGYPGNVKVKVTYKFDNNNKLHIIYSATSDKDTILNMTNHTYFNLDGAENTQENAVYNHLVKLPNSSRITKVDDISVSTGDYVNIENTPLDFRTFKKIGDVIDNEHPQTKITSGFDQNYCVDNYDGKSLIEVAEVKSTKTGIKLRVLSNLPGFQFYTANNLGKKAQPNGKSGSRYEKKSAFCIEPQFYPNAINIEQFQEKGILKAGEKYNREIVYNFSVEK